MFIGLVRVILSTSQFQNQQFAENFKYLIKRCDFYSDNFLSYYPKFQRLMPRTNGVKLNFDTKIGVAYINCFVNDESKKIN
jgi:hypothetical protein